MEKLVQEERFLKIVNVDFLRRMMQLSHVLYKSAKVLNKVGIK
jgi:hypothetical protein